MGHAYAWCSPYLKIDDRLASGTYKEFTAAITRRFRDTKPRSTAERQLAALRQTGSVSEYAREFERLTAILNYNNDAKRSAFKNGLKYDVLDRLVGRPEPEDFYEFVNAITDLDNDLADLRFRRSNGATSQSKPQSTGNRCLSDEEYQRRMQANLCLRCGKAGHMIRDCSGSYNSGQRNANVSATADPESKNTTGSS